MGINVCHLTLLILELLWLTSDDLAQSSLDVGGGVPATFEDLGHQCCLLLQFELGLDAQHLHMGQAQLPGLQSPVCLMDDIQLPLRLVAWAMVSSSQIAT